MRASRPISHRRSNSIASSLGNLGSVYESLGQYQRAIEFDLQSLKIQREIGDRHGEANSLFNQGFALAKYKPQSLEFLDVLKQARTIYVELKLDNQVRQCDEIIDMFDLTIATESD